MCKLLFHVCLLVASCLCVIQVDSTRVYRAEALTDQYATLDKILTDEMQSEDPEENMDLIKKLYDGNTKKETRLAQAEDTFMSLRYLGNGKLCNGKGFEVIGLNLKAVFGKLEVKDADVASDNLRRLKLLSMHYIKQHEVVCRNKAPRQVERIVKDLDQEQVEILSNVADEYIERYILPKVRKDAHYKFEAEELFEVVKKAYKVNYGYVYETLVGLTNNDPMKSYLKPHDGRIDRAKLEVLLNKYLIKPCQSFTDKLIYQVYGPASFWVSFHEPDLKEPEFYRVWSRVKFCVYLHEGKAEILKKLADENVKNLSRRNYL